MKPLPADEKNPPANHAGPADNIAGAADNVGADDLILWLAYKEAKELIGFDATPAAAPPEKK